MRNGQNQLLVDISKKRTTPRSRRSSYIAMNRVQKIRDKRMVYPQSTLNKIVFVSNMEGNGFQRQNIYLYDVPSHIDLEGMISGIDMICFNQWRSSYEALQAEPLHGYDLFQKVIAALTLIVILTFVYFVSMEETANTQILAYIFLVLIILGCINTLLLMRQSRVEVNKDVQMIKSIKRRLITLNQTELNEFQGAARFTWTCHKDCLWIVCKLY